MSSKSKSLAFGLAAVLAASAAHAQHSTGNLMGEAKAGDTIVLEAPEIGVHREIAVESDGKYSVRRLPLGNYVVTVRHADGSTEPKKAVSVRGGTTVRIK